MVRARHAPQWAVAAKKEKKKKRRARDFPIIITHTSSLNGFLFHFSFFDPLLFQILQLFEHSTVLHLIPIPTSSASAASLQLDLLSKRLCSYPAICPSRAYPTIRSIWVSKSRCVLLSAPSICMPLPPSCETAPSRCLCSCPTSCLGVNS